MKRRAVLLARWVVVRYAQECLLGSPLLFGTRQHSNECMSCSCHRAARKEVAGSVFTNDCNEKEACVACQMNTTTKKAVLLANKVLVVAGSMSTNDFNGKEDLLPANA
eukprot:1150589-Pelagomonas_calceolata.AAC.3